jgi:cell migration-inducing and hyaluronan-binding protein
VSAIDNYTAYKNRNGAIWSRGENHLYRNMKLADNAIGFTHASGGAGLAPFTSRVVDSLFVGESGNIGNPRTPQEVAYGRSLPKDAADFPIRGYEYYDYRHDVVNTTFVNYQPNATRDAGAISYLLFTSFGMSTENAVEGLKFVNAKPVDFPQSRPAGRPTSAAGQPIGARRSMTSTARSAEFPAPTSSSTTASPPTRTTCEVRASWGAAVCRGDMGRFNIAGDFDDFGRRPITDPIMLNRNGKRFEYSGETTIPERRRGESGDGAEGPVACLAGNGQGFVRDPRATRIHQGRFGHGTGQPGCTARRAEHVVLPGRQHAVGQAGGRGSDPAGPRSSSRSAPCGRRP